MASKFLKLSDKNLYLRLLCNCFLDDGDGDVFLFFFSYRFKGSNPINKTLLNITKLGLLFTQLGLLVAKLDLLGIHFCLLFGQEFYGLF